MVTWSLFVLIFFLLLFLLFFLLGTRWTVPLHVLRGLSRDTNTGPTGKELQ